MGDSSNRESLRERFYVFAASEDRARRMADPLRAVAEVVDCSVPSVEVPGVPLTSPESVAEAVLASKVTAVLIDSHWGLARDDHSWEKLSEKRLIALRRELAGDSLPPSLSLLTKIRSIQGSESRLLAIFFIENPSVALTQEILQLGADWVWPHISGTRVPELLPRLRSAMNRERPHLKRKPRVLVVENSRSTCERLAVELETFCDLDFVGSEKPGNSFEIAPEEAVAKFQAGTYDLVIVDLALSRAAEQVAAERFFAGEDAQLATFYQAQAASGQNLIQTIWGGVEVIKAISAISPETVIVAMSLYLKETLAIDIMNIYLGREAMQKVTILAKDDLSFGELRDILIAARNGSPIVEEVSNVP